MNYKDLFFGVCIFVLGFAILKEDEDIPKQKDELPSDDKVNISSPPCLRMYDAINKYADMYNIPKVYAFGIAYKETRYNGPFDWKYRHAQTSYAGAIGPMQIMPSTADLMWRDSKVSRTKLMNDIDFNVHTSMKLLRKLHDRYRDWKTVFGCYNTGRPMINQYAIDVFNHKIKWNI